MHPNDMGVVLAVAHLVELHRQADLRHRAQGRRGDRAPAGSGPWQATKETAVLLHHHEPGVFDPDHCRACARQAGVLDHYHRVQQQQVRLWQAHRHARWALWSSSAALLLAAAALLSR